MTPPILNRSVGEPPSADLPHEPAHAGSVAHVTGGVAEIELGQVAVKVGFADVVVRPVDGSLQLREEVLGAVHRDVAADVLADVVVDRVMLTDSRGDCPVGQGGIGDARATVRAQ